MGHAEPIRYQESADLPYEPERMFDLVADIERYPEFLPEYRAVRVLARTRDGLRVEQVIGLSTLELTLSAVATLRRPEAILVRSHQLLLGELEIRWGFVPTAAGTRVDFRMALTPPSRFASGLVGHLLRKSAARTLGAFVERADRIYGRGGDAADAG